MSTEKKPKISLARQHRAIHASEAALDKHYVSVGLYGSVNPEDLEKRKTQHIEAMEAARGTWDLCMEFPDEFSSFLRELEGRRDSTRKAA